MPPFRIYAAFLVNRFYRIPFFFSINVQSYNLQNLRKLHAKYAQSAKTAELNLRNTARKTLDKKAMLALFPKPNTFV